MISFDEFVGKFKEGTTFNDASGATYTLSKIYRNGLEIQRSDDEQDPVQFVAINKLYNTYKAIAEGKSGQTSSMTTPVSPQGGLDLLVHLGLLKRAK